MKSVLILHYEYFLAKYIYKSAKFTEICRGPQEDWRFCAYLKMITMSKKEERTGYRVVHMCALSYSPPTGN